MHVGENKLIVMWHFYIDCVLYKCSYLAVIQLCITHPTHLKRTKKLLSVTFLAFWGGTDLFIHVTHLQVDVSYYLSIVQHSHRAELTTGYVDNHFVLQAAADPAWCRLVGSRPWTNLARVIVTPCVHLNTEIHIYVNSPKIHPVEADSN